MPGSVPVSVLHEDEQEGVVGSPSYILVTPVRDEEATIEVTLRSVISQTLRPTEWVIVSDNSADATDEIVYDYSLRHSFIRLMRIDGGGTRDFASVVRALLTGIAAIETSDYGFVGLLDGDVSFEPHYYASLVSKFGINSKLGLVGGLVVDFVNGKPRRGRQYLKDVAGATQFFSRECFESLSGLVAIPQGGWDAITCVEARGNGFLTATFPDLVVRHLKPRNSAQGSTFARNWQMGTRDYALGNHPVFEIIKCGALCLEQPVFAGAVVRLLAFAACSIAGEERVIGRDLVKSVRREQTSRLFPLVMKSTTPWGSVRRR